MRRNRKVLDAWVVGQKLGQWRRLRAYILEGRMCLQVHRVVEQRRTPQGSDLLNRVEQQGRGGVVICHHPGYGLHALPALQRRFKVTMASSERLELSNRSLEPCVTM